MVTTTFFLSGEIVLFICIVLLFLLSLIIRIEYKEDEIALNKAIKSIYYYSVLLSCFLVFYVILVTSECIYEDIFMFNNMIICNDRTQKIKLILLILVIIYLYLLMEYIKRNYINIINYTLIVLLSIEGLLILVSSNDLCLGFISLELFSLCLYTMLSSKDNSSVGIGIAWKYFVMSCFTFLIGLYGISLIYSVFGTTKLDSLSILLSNSELNYYFYIGYILMVISLFFKLGIFPFHFWVTYVYNKSYLIIVIFFSIIPKFGYVYFLWNIVILYNMYYLFVIVGVLSIIYGTILSLFENSLVRLLGYSSISNIGYVIVGLGVGTIDSYASSFFYLFIYTFLLITIFIFILFFYKRDVNGNTYYIDDITSLYLIYKVNYIYSIFFIMIILSIGGIPFFGGFYSKFYLFMSLINSKSYFLSFVILVCSTISVIYHIRLLRFIVFIPTNKEVKLEYPLVESFSNVLTLLMVILCILNIMMIIFHPFIYLFFKIIVLCSVI